MRLTESPVRMLPMIDIVTTTVLHTGIDAIDFLDIDAEGSEWFILQDYDFTKGPPIHVISIEIEKGDKKSKIGNLLARNGYIEGEMAGHDYVWYRKCGPWEQQQDC